MSGMRRSLTSVSPMGRLGPMTKVEDAFEAVTVGDAVADLLHGDGGERSFRTRGATRHNRRRRPRSSRFHAPDGEPEN